MAILGQRLPALFGGAEICGMQCDQASGDVAPGRRFPALVGRRIARPIGDVFRAAVVVRIRLGRKEGDYLSPRDVVAAEQSTPPMDSAEQGKAALTELFDEARNDNTEVIVKRIVADIDEIVRFVRFDGWQNTHAGEREVKKALRSTLFKYRLHQDADLFNRSYGYIRQYY